MDRNVGGADRTARLVAGSALIGGALFAPVDGRLRALMGLGGAVALGSGLTGYCPANAALGIDTSESVADALEDADFSRLPRIETGASAAGIVTG